jgi:acyl dehydratase
MRYFEDFVVGDIIDHGTRTVSADDIVAFAREFDPQPFHVDADAPETAFTGGLIASGWHVAAIFMRMMCDSFLLDSSSMGSPGIETLKWVQPVRPGSSLTGRSVVIDTRVSQSRPERGIVRFRHELADGDGAVVLWFENPVMFGRRP